LGPKFKCEGGQLQSGGKLQSDWANCNPGVNCNPIESEAANCNPGVNCNPIGSDWVPSSNPRAANCNSRGKLQSDWVQLEVRLGPIAIHGG